MKLLHIDSSILGEGSVSRQLTASIVEQFRKADPSIEVITRDLVAEPVPHMTIATLPAANPDLRDDLKQLQSADIVVIGAPMYNFSVPTQLKAWIDRIAIAGESFRYTEKGPEGLLGGRRVIVALSRGGMYGAGSPAESLEHTETYLRSVFGFIGITPEFIAADGIGLGPDARAAAIEKALDNVSALAA